MRLTLDKTNVTSKYKIWWFPQNYLVGTLKAFKTKLAYFISNNIKPHGQLAEN